MKWVFALIVVVAVLLVALGGAAGLSPEGSEANASLQTALLDLDELRAAGFAVARYNDTLLVAQELFIVAVEREHARAAADL